MSLPARFPQRRLPLLLVLPQLLVVLLFFVYPSVQALVQSFFIAHPFSGVMIFVGLENFAGLFGDPLYWQAFGTTIVFASSVAFGTLAISMVLAGFADRRLKGIIGFRTAILWPYAVAPATAGVLWLFLFDANVGAVTPMLQALGLNWNPLLVPWQAMTLVVAAAIWKQISYNFVFLLAALQAVPLHLTEAAALDGAGPVRRFWTIALPIISPTIFFLIVMNTIYAFFDTFGVIHAVTQGGPAGATTTLVYRVWNDGFRLLDLGSSSAQSLILMVLVVILTGVQFKLIERRVHYD